MAKVKQRIGVLWVLTLLWWGAAATILYTLVGGFLAVSWTDTVQASLMIFALLLVPVMVVIGVGGPGAGLALVEQVDPARLDLVGTGGMIAVVSALAWGLGYFGQPHILARFMAAESVGAIPNARRIGMTWMVLCLAGSVSVGLLGIAWYAADPGASLADPERVFVNLSQQLFNPWIAGILLSAILAAIMSTLSAQLLVCSSALTEDFYRGFVRPRAGQRELVWFGRASVLAVALLAIWIARDPESRVLGLVAYAWAGFGAAFGPVVLLSLFWQRMTRNGAIAGIFVGAITVILWKQSGSPLYEIVPGFILFFFGVGAWLVAILCLFLDIPINLQIVIFLGTSLLTAALFRKWVKTKLGMYREADQVLEDELIGKRAVAETDILPDQQGKVDFRGTIWDASSDVAVKAGETVTASTYAQLKTYAESALPPTVAPASAPMPRASRSSRSIRAPAR